MVLIFSGLRNGFFPNAPCISTSPKNKFALIKRLFFYINYDEYNNGRKRFCILIRNALCGRNGAGGLFFGPHDGGEN